MPSHPGICVRASQFRRRRASCPHPGTTAETIRHLLNPPGYDQSRTLRRSEFIGVWGYLVFLAYCVRRVDCKQCGVVVEEVPWGVGKHSATKVYLHFLGHWARKLSLKETAEEFRTSWDKVRDAETYLVAWGLEHRVLGAIRAIPIGVDDVQYSKGHKISNLGVSD